MSSEILEAISNQAAGRPENGDTLARVRAVSRAIAIMRAFTPSQPYLTLGEVASRANLDAGTARRLLVTLRDEQIIRQNRQTGRYCLTIQAMRFAAAVPDGQSLRDIAEDLINQLAHQISATVLLSVLRDGEAVCLARFHGDAPVQVRWWSVGGVLPLNCGAAPKLLLAHMEPDAQKHFLAGPLTALTRRGVTDPEQLAHEIARIRATGWCHARDDVVEGLAAIAAPVRDNTGRVVAAVSVGGLPLTIGDPTQDGPPPPALAALLACCAAISQRLEAHAFTS